MLQKGYALMLALLVSLFLFSCASVPRGPAFIPASLPAGKALLYFYRPARFSLSGRTIFMAFPGSDKSYAMVNRGYYPLIVGPGSVEVAGIGTDLKPVYFKTDAKEGTEIYVRVEFDDSMSLNHAAKFQLVPAAEATSEIRDCTMISVAE